MGRQGFALLLAVLLLATGCAHVDYIGRSYPQTAQVDLFFAEQEVMRPYDVMGRVVANAPDIVSLEKVQKKIMEKAREKGADAVVIVGLDRYKSGEQTQVSETTRPGRGGTTRTTGSSSTTSQNEKEVSGLFIKYR